MPDPFAVAQDVADIWRPLTPAETAQATNLIVKASARLRQKAPFDIDARMALFGTDPADPTALDPAIVADLTAVIVKRVMANPNGAVSTSESAGPFSHSTTYAARGVDPADVGNTMRVTDADIDQLRVAQPANLPSTIKLREHPHSPCRLPTESEVAACLGWPL